MKGLLSVISAVAIVVAAAGVSEAGIGFRATGGYSHISYGDFNDYADEANEILAGTAKIDNISWIPELGGEFYYSITPMVEIGIGTGMVWGTSDYSISAGLNSMSFEHKMKAFPINATVYFRPRVPFISMKPYIYGGGGRYYTKLDFDEYVKEVTIPYEERYTAELSSWGWGVHGGGGVEFSIVPSLSLDLGFKIRWASIGGFEGTATDLAGETWDIFMAGYTDSDDNWHYEYRDVEEKDDYDEGKVDLTGYTIYIGFKAGF